MRIYLASSWRNAEQPRVLSVLRIAGHVVYDFREPLPGETGFGWRQVDGEGAPTTVERYRKAIAHPMAVRGFGFDMEGLNQCDACVLLLPCGRSAHLEAGWARGKGKRLVIYTRDGEEPELMYKLAHSIVANDVELLGALR